MNTLRNLWKLAKALNPCPPMALPYHDLRRFFQFGSVVAIAGEVTKDNPCVTIPSSIFAQASMAQIAYLFDNPENTVTAGRFVNNSGGSIIHGEITTHDKNGHGAAEYMYIVITGHAEEGIIPYFAYIGQKDLISELNQDAKVTTVAVLGMFELDDDMNPCVQIVPPHNYERINHAMAAGDISMLFILSDIVPHPEAIAEAIASRGTLRCVQAFDYHAGTRTPQSLNS